MMNVWLPAPLLSTFLWGLWLTINQTLEFDQILLGALLAWWLPWVTQQLRPIRAPRLKQPWLLLRLLFMVLCDVVRSNIMVSWIILSGREKYQHSGFITVPLNLRNPYGLAVLSVIINSAPGSVWGELRQDRKWLMMHILDLRDEQLWVDIIKNRYERLLKAVFE